jgi:hypothetical protein
MQPVCIRVCNVAVLVVVLRLRLLLLLLLAGHHQWPWPRAEHRAVPHKERDPNRRSNQPRQQVRWQGDMAAAMGRRLVIAVWLAMLVDWQPAGSWLAVG